MRRAAGALLLLLAVSPGFGCRGGRPPDVVLITLDTTRADRLGAYGDPEARTPALDAFAARGVVFERAYSSAPLTLPAHTSILTGLSPDAHGVHDNGRFVVPESLETLAERLAERGYATGAFVSAFVLDSSFGLDQGFAAYDDETESDGDPLTFAVPHRRGEEVTDRALAWLAERGRRPFFLWAHYYDAHAPRDPPAPFDEIADPYAGEIAYVDAQVGRLLAGVEQVAAGRARLLIVVGDHGESLGQHGETTHGVVAYDSTLRVPLLAVGPGFEAGARSPQFARIEDVAPTVLAALGETLPVGSDGLPLQQLLGADTARERLATFESFGPFYGMGWARLSGVRTARWKYTAEPAPPELYDVLADPDEQHDRIADEPEVAARLAAQHAARTAQERAEEAPAEDLDPDVEERLAALGYLTTPQRFAPGEAPDPRKAVRLLGWVRLASSLAREGRVADGIEALEILTREPAVRAFALRHLAALLSVAGRTEAAIEAHGSLLALTGAMEARVSLANALLAADRAEDALATLAALDGMAKAPASVQLARARAWLALGRTAEAEAAAHALLEQDPSRDAALALASRIRAAQEGADAEIERLRTLLANPPAGAGRLVETRTALATLLRATGRDAEAVPVLEALEPPPAAHVEMLAQIAFDHGNLERAIALYEALLERVPAANRARRELADLYDAQGRPEDAVARYDELVAVDPGDASLRVDRGATLFRLGRLSEAEADFRAALARDDRIPEASFNLGLLELERGRDGEAERHLLRAVELRPDFAKAYFHLARVYRRRGDPRAGEHAERAARSSGGPAGRAQVTPPASAATGPEPLDPLTNR